MDPEMDPEIRDLVNDVVKWGFRLALVIIIELTVIIWLLWR